MEEVGQAVRAPEYPGSLITCVCYQLPFYLMMLLHLEYEKLEVCTSIPKLLSSVNLWDDGVSRAWARH